MTDMQRSQPGNAFWGLSAFFLVFNFAGLMIYYNVVTTPPEVLADNLSPEKLAFLNAEPLWAHAAYATAVTAGVIASVLLLLRRAWAFPAYVVSFVAVLIQDLDSFVLRNGVEVWGVSGLYLPAVVIIVCVAELWYTRRAKANGWLA